ncbi:MAG: hypothetical protein ACRYFX_08390 [Janthinobacterium lividum]
MERNKAGFLYVLLPVFFKKIGWTLVGFATAALAAKIIWADEVLTHSFWRLLVRDAVLLGLLLVSWSRDRDEDEMTTSIRLKAMAWAFTQTVFFVILAPLLNLEVSGEYAALMLLGDYLLTYYWQKKYR